MKYYVVEISEGASSIAGKAVYEFSTLNDAIASFHKKLGTAMSSDLYTSDLVMVINSVGGVHKSEYYIVETETTEETTDDTEE